MATSNAKTYDVYGGSIGYSGREVGDSYIIKIKDDRPWMRGEIETSKFPTGVVKDEYVSATITVRALLQEKIEMTTKSEWSPLTAAAAVSNFGMEVMTVLTGRTLVGRWMTRRVWQGTTPINFTLNLRFEAQKDAEREVLFPCKELQRMCLPYAGNKPLGEYFLSPPGPLAFDWREAVGQRGSGEIIDIHIGHLFVIKKCIIESINTTFFPRFTSRGTPTGAVVSINFQTYQIITKEFLDSEVYPGKKLYQEKAVKDIMDKVYRKITEVGENYNPTQEL